MLARAFLLFGVVLSAHPLGNFSVSHYTRIEVAPHAVNVTYVLDLGEVPTFTLLRDWKLGSASSATELNAKAQEQAREWAKGLEFRSAGQPVEPVLKGAQATLSDGTDRQKVARIAMSFELSGVKSPLTFEDRNYPDRAGWKEIVIDASGGARIATASQGSADRSKELTAYPPLAMQAAPQDLRASVEWGTSAAAARIVPIPQPAAVPQPVTGSATPAAASQTQNGDYLSRLLGRKDIGLGWLLVGIAVAFGFGAAHALTPGHGKTIVAAYLVGSRGTMKHAAFLGAMVTFTHTSSVFLLGIGTLLLSKYIVPEKIIPVLGAISGLSIVAVGASLFYKRLKRLQAADAHHHHHHHHHGHDHDHHHHHHHHHDHEHSHVPQGDITLGSLIALGASGGLVPCPSALVLLLSSIALGHVGAGLILLVAFSLGLAGVLMAIGMMVLYAKSWLPDPVKTSRHPFFRLVPVLSALVIVCIGLLMTGVSLGWVRPGLAG